MSDLSPKQSNRHNILTKYGSGCIAYHTRQGGLDYFDFEDGYIAYKEYGGHRFVLGDPVCSLADMPHAIESFCAKHDYVTFLHISPICANILEEFGFYVNEMGEEARIDLSTYSFSGRKKVSLRNMHNTAKRLGVTVEEWADDIEHNESAREISRLWLSKVKRSRREMWFITRRPIYSVQGDVRRFYAVLDGIAVAFADFDPMWKDGALFGYCASILRRLPEAPSGALDLIVSNAMEKFKAEGIETLSLGLMPLYKIEDDLPGGKNYSWFSMRLFRWAYNSLITNNIYGYRSLSFHKERYRSDGAKIYLATKSRYPIRPLYKAGRLIGVI